MSFRNLSADFLDLTPYVELFKHEPMSEDHQQLLQAPEAKTIGITLSTAWARLIPCCRSHIPSSDLPKPTPSACRQICQQPLPSTDFMAAASSSGTTKSALSSAPSFTSMSSFRLAQGLLSSRPPYEVWRFKKQPPAHMRLRMGMKVCIDGASISSSGHTAQRHGYLCRVVNTEPGVVCFQMWLSEFDVQHPDCIVILAAPLNSVWLSPSEWLLFYGRCYWSNIQPLVDPWKHSAVMLEEGTEMDIMHSSALNQTIMQQDPIRVHQEQAENKRESLQVIESTLDTTLSETFILAHVQQRYSLDMLAARRDSGTLDPEMDIANALPFPFSSV
ncbi:hypothetical protein BKA70DRAFT_1239686 [Coprinopsis sp. MPI-PUGE-AT-0042]|nr:hypothetical protein BKA70DRAFT_1239686 [Coprinopsis sp. MPI-PUGE-AT-0042]